MIPYDQLSLQNKRVLIRVDFNVPFDEEYRVTDDTRIRKAIPTIEHALNQGGAVLLMSHLGRPQKKKLADGSIDRERFTLRHVLPVLRDHFTCPIHFAADCVGEEALEKANTLPSGAILVLENTRFHAEELSGDVSFARSLANLADIYVNDAFGSAHRAHASTSIVAHFFKPTHKAIGFLMRDEMANANRVLQEAKKPFTAIIGGAKVSDKIRLLERLIDLVDNLLIGGGMAYTFIAAQGGAIGESLCEPGLTELANELLLKAKGGRARVFLPADSMIANNFAPDALTDITSSDNIPSRWMGLDIGPQCQSEYESIIRSSKTILWNGPMGVFEFESFRSGTHVIAQAVASATTDGAFSLVGGGDSVAAIEQSGLAEHISFISTGGGAMLQYMEGQVLPGIAAVTSE